jgi:hypothetical protein
VKFSPLASTYFHHSKSLNRCAEKMLVLKTCRKNSVFIARDILFILNKIKRRYKFIPSFFLKKKRRRPPVYNRFNSKYFSVFCKVKATCHEDVWSTLSSRISYTSALNEDYLSVPRSDPFTSAEIRY